MVSDPDRRPTAQEIEELIDLVRRDPRSPAFIDLGEAYLALGRPKDALGVGHLGLEAAPESIEGRVMVARAHASMHQWKEAQGELLRVVKIDRSNRLGFSLLGEVLLRRSDFERAVPVLQHAQNLDPTSPMILSMLKRARAGQTLDAPPPIPTPVPPRGETDNSGDIQRSPPPRGPIAPSRSRESDVAQRSEPAASPRHAAREGIPPRREAKQSAPPPISVEGIRPRVIASEKPQNAAAASLRQSAAVGESYLNDLLTGGLLDVAGVRSSDRDFDLRPDRRWGRSTRRAFIFLFVVLVLGIGGGGTWYWWSEQQKAEAIARLQKESKQAIGDGDFAGFEASLKKLSEALEKDTSNLLTFAYVVETAGLESLLYGTDANRVDQAIKAVGKDIVDGDPGARELVIGKAAVELGRLGAGEGNANAVLSASKSTLGEVRKMLDEYLASNDGDKWAHWLKGRALLAGGERKAARAELKLAAEGEDGVLVALIDLGDLLVDDGQLDEAIKVFDQATAKSKDHPLAVAGRSLGRAEGSVQVTEAIDELSVKLDKNLGPRVGAYRNLALALANAGIEDYPKAIESLRKATAQHPPNEPRFWARVAWAHYARGDIAGTAVSRARIAWYGNAKPEDDPTVQLVDAALLLASGLPEQALDKASKIDGIRPRILRAYALIDLGKAKDALAEADAVLKQAPENVEAQILREEARMINGPAKERAAAAEALAKLALRAKGTLPLHALGMALLATGDPKNAQIQLEQAIAKGSEISPNPLGYRTRTALAELFLASGDVENAGKQLDESLKINSGYFPSLGLQAKIVLRNGEPQRALELLDPIFKEPAATTPQLLLVQAEAFIVNKASTRKEKENAKAILEAIKDKITPQTEVSRVAALLDPRLPKEMGLPEPAKAETPDAPRPPVIAPKPPRRRGR